MPFTSRQLSLFALASIFPLSAAAIAACGNSDDTDGFTDAGTDASTKLDASATPDAGDASSTITVDSGANPADSGTSTTLSGTWDLVESAGGDSQTGSLVLSSTELLLTLGTDVLTYNVNGAVLTASWTTDGTTKAIPLTRTPATTAVSYGAIPLAMDGTWTFGAATDGQIALTVASGSTSMTANTYIGGLPYPIPVPTPDVAYNSTRGAATTSIFGDLGGTWTSGEAGFNEGCTVTFTGSTFTANCDDSAYTLAGSATLTFNAGLTAASGTAASGGVELSAKKQ